MLCQLSAFWVDIGYLVFAAFAWEAGKWIYGGPHSGLIFGSIYAILACVLIAYGFKSASNVCAASGIGSRLTSFSFFIATSLYVIPFPLAGLLGRFPAVRITARLAAGIMGCYYLYRGLIMIHGGLRT
jgi:hypothetical protein